MQTRLLKAEMVKKKYTQAELAKAIGIAPNTLNRKLLGQREFTVSEAKKICDVLDIENPVEIFLS